VCATDALDFLFLKGAQQLALGRQGLLPISSRNSVPPLARSNRPGRDCMALVNAPSRRRTVPLPPVRSEWRRS